MTRTLDAQQESFDNSPALKREIDYFAENIPNIQTAENLVNDRMLLKVALGAFGLEDDINHKAFIQKVLTDGTLEPDALANRLSDKRYLEFSKAFGFGDFDTANTQLSDFSDNITRSYLDRQFEVAVGTQNEDMRLALGVERELAEISTRNISENAKWFTMMGSAPLRQVFETAMSLPAGFGTLDIDRQLDVFRSKAQGQFGDSSLSQFKDPEAREALIRNFLVRSGSQLQNQTVASGQAALSLLQSGPKYPSFF